MLVALPAAAWIWIVAMARDMYGPMTGASAWMMTSRWDPPHVLLLFAMWAAMMAAMMLPSAAPLVVLVARRAAATSTPSVIYALAAGYLAVWTAFSLGATLLQRGLAVRFWLTPMMEAATPQASAVLLLVAGLYQFTPLKQACLRACRSPIDILMTRWRPGARGAFRLGLSHGVYCVGCCWALMLLLFAGGVMHPATIGALTAVVLMEKLSPFGTAGSKIVGAACLVSAAALFAVS